jgi:hypothetical protein
MNSDTVTPDGFIKVEDMTDESMGYVQASLLSSYEEEKQGEYEKVSSVLLNTKEERAAKIVEIVKHYYENADESKSLYSSDDRTKISTLTKIFPIELVLAIIAQETGSGGGDFDNERVAGDYGHGVMQITMAKYKDKKGITRYYDNRGISSRVKLLKCMYVDQSDSRTNIADYLKCYEPVFNSKGVLYKQIYDNYEHSQDHTIYKQYVNTLQSIYSNIKDGLAILVNNNQVARTNSCKNSSYSKEDITFNCDDIIKVKTVWFFNGKSFRADQNYMAAISDKLKNLKNYFQGHNYPNTDNLVEKLQIANNNRLQIDAHSPVEVSIVDSSGNAVGLVGGEIKEDIDNSSYDELTERAVIFFPDDTYTYEVVGDSTGGTYGLDIDIWDNSDEPISFRAIGLPILPGEKHIYKVDKEKLKKNDPDAVTITIDKEGDGTPEYILHSGSELTDITKPKEPPTPPSPDLETPTPDPVVTPNTNIASGGVVPVSFLTTPATPHVLGAQTENTNINSDHNEELTQTKPELKKITNKAAKKKVIKVSITKKPEPVPQAVGAPIETKPIQQSSSNTSWFKRFWQKIFR